MRQISGRHLIAVMVVVWVAAARDHGDVGLLVDLVAVAEVCAVAPLGAVVGVELPALAANPFHRVSMARLVQVFSPLLGDATGGLKFGPSL